MQELVISLLQKMFILTLQMSVPILLVGVVIGLMVSIFQTVTQIQESTLTFVPKILAIFLALMLLGGWMLDNMSGFMVQLWSDFSIYIG